MEDRYSRGLAKLNEIDGAQGQRVVDSLKDIALGNAAPQLKVHVHGALNVDCRCRSRCTPDSRRR